MGLEWNKDKVMHSLLYLCHKYVDRLTSLQHQHPQKWKESLHKIYMNENIVPLAQHHSQVVSTRLRFLFGWKILALIDFKRHLFLPKLKIYKSFRYTPSWFTPPKMYMSSSRRTAVWKERGVGAAFVGIISSHSPRWSERSKRRIETHSKSQYFKRIEHTFVQSKTQQRVGFGFCPFSWRTTKCDNSVIIR